MMALALTGLVLANVMIWAQRSEAWRNGALGQLALITDVRHEIVQEFVEEPDQDKLVDAAVKGMIESLNDPYTAYLSPDDLKNFDRQVRGSFSGIGAEIALDDDGRLQIVSPLEGSPAWEAGVLAGDLVIEIDGKSTKDITILQAVDRLTGPEGTQVTIKVRHPSGDEETLKITRARINIQTIRGFRRDADQHWDYLLDPENKIAYVRLTSFGGNTTEDLRKTLEELKKSDVAGLIVDVRFNGGGLLTAAQQISDMFLPGGKRIVSVKGRRVDENVTLSTDDATMTDVPMVILANETSASASEILTGALSDNGRAKFIGTRTFGKGSVQQIKMFEGGQGAIKITNAYYYLPNGRNIHKREGKETWGVDPEEGFYVPMSLEQTREMLKLRRQGEIVRLREGEARQPMTPKWIKETLKDPQLAAGLEAMVGKLKTGDWPKVGQSAVEELAKLSKRDNLIRQRDLLNERLTQVQAELAKLGFGEPEIEQGAIIKPEGDAAAPTDDAEPKIDTPGADSDSDATSKEGAEEAPAEKPKSKDAPKP